MSDDEVGSKLCAENGDKSCTRCLGYECNSNSVVNGAKLSCVKCTSEEGACEWGIDKEEATKCTSDVWLGDSETCYSYQTEEGVTRGCSLDATNVCPAETTVCKECVGAGCNSMTYKKFKCYQCDSKKAGEESCADKVEGLSVTECSSDYQTYFDQGCYLLKNEDESVVRGCVSDLSAAWKADCIKGDDEACKVCGDEGCNNQPGGAAALVALSTFALLLIALMVGY